VSFFEEVDSLGVVEANIQAVHRIEQDQARKLLNRFREIRFDLRNELEMDIPPGTFTAQKMRGSLVQIERAITELSKRLEGGMGDAAGVASERGVDDLVKEIQAFEEHFKGAVIPIDFNAAALASDAQSLAISRYESSIGSYSAALKADIARQVQNAVIEQLNVSQMVERLNRYMAGEEWKIQRLARTEIHNVYNLSKLGTIREIRDTQLDDLQKTLMHPMDARTASDSKYAASLQLIANIDEPFVYRWGGKVRTYMSPPDRPNDRSVMVPYRSAWGGVRSVFEPINSRLFG
jgi:hypothetical protein